MTPDSPCIDAGNPLQPFDPDNTRLDLGDFYFEQDDFTLENLTIMVENDDIIIFWEEVAFGRIYYHC
ncbi:MAG: hypothetical protein H8E46_11460 [FCB group bacterium]|nr:hypothetical protein [FCB group bacterium]